LPEKTLTNAELEQRVDTTDAWITARTGIRKRHIAAPDETCCDLAEVASRKALEAAGLELEDIDLIVLATTTPDQVFPSTACLLQKRLAIRGCAAFDVQAACAGFMYGFGIADNFIRAGSARRALVVGAELFSRIIDWTDRGTCILFGDGAGAVILEFSDEPGVLSTHLHADGRYANLLGVPWGVAQGYDRLTEETKWTQMHGNEVFKCAVHALEQIVDETLKANGMEKGAVDWLVPHQANIRIINATARKLKLPMEHVVVTVHEHGNTSAASVPLALDVAVRDGRIKRGETLLMEAFGGGFTWGAALVRW
jgi:3-oxoacyl-(acyl-carrier-protein) synthase III